MKPESRDKYYLRQYADLHFPHGGIGYVDLETILDQQGYLPVELSPAHQKNSSVVQRLFNALRWISRLGKGSTLVFIFPVYARMNRLLLRLAARKKIHLICILADIDGVKDGSDSLLKKELKFLKRFNSFIVHNAVMRQWLESVFPSSDVAELAFFDYLAEPVEHQRTPSPVIAFAGNLGKSGFLHKLDNLVTTSPELRFILYGPALPEPIRGFPNCLFKGIVDPRLLPGLIEGSFGLVWDGDGLAEPEGSLGVYMGLISQHKLSLYILSGLPVIIHSKAAMATFIQQHHLGLLVSDLHEIMGKIKALPEESYQLMRSNMIPLAAKIGRGECLRSALEALA